MFLFIIRIFIFLVATLSSVGFYHVFTHKTQSEILVLTKEFHEAYKNQDYYLINQILADNVTNTSAEYNGCYDKSNVLDGLKSYKTDKAKIVSIEITPIWIQADRKNPSFTFELKSTILFEGKPSTFYGQYTFIFEERQTTWQIVSMNFDINYRETKPHWLARKIIGLARISKSISG